MQMCELKLEETGLARRKGAEILEVTATAGYRRTHKQFLTIFGHSVEQLFNLTQRKGHIDVT